MDDDLVFTDPDAWDVFDAARDKLLGPVSPVAS